MACFICSKYGHWASKCPDATCKFCGEHGHSTSACAIKAKTQDTITHPETFEDILYANHMTPQPSMRTMVDVWVKKNFQKRCMVDEYALVDYIFNNSVFSTSDMGHVSVVTYIIAKYCDLGPHPEIKEFLKGVQSDIFQNNLTTFKSFLHKHGMTIVSASNKTHYRKLSGFSS